MRNEEILLYRCILFTSLTDFAQLLILWPNRPSLTSNIAILGPIVHECKAEIDAFLDKIILKYGRRLGGGVEDNSRRRKGLKEIGKMLQWSMFERGEVARLKEKVERANMMIQLAYSEAQGCVHTVPMSSMYESLIKNFKSCGGAGRADCFGENANAGRP